MTEARTARLQGLPGWRWARETESGRPQGWEAQCLALQAFLRENTGRYPSKGRAATVRPPAPTCRIPPAGLAISIAARYRIREH